jgi:hypothetical protein
VHVKRQCVGVGAVCCLRGGLEMELTPPTKTTVLAK